jgi:hypothetical protein
MLVDVGPGESWVGHPLRHRDLQLRTYPDRTTVYDILGFGKPPEYEAFAATPEIAEQLLRVLAADCDAPTTWPI